jgi:4,5-dihydroxyphthalate decarboxylase
MADLPFSVCFWNYDRTNPLLDGRVTVAGAAPEFTVLSPPENFIRTFTEQPFDVTEMSFSNYMSAYADDSSPYVAIPVFLSRTFRHGAIFVRTDRGINVPADLEGKTIGLVEYDMTAAVVVRGLLRDEYGVDTKSIHWRVGDPEVPWRETIPIPWVPYGTDVQPMEGGATLNDALVNGSIDALIGIEAPSCFTSGTPGITRLFPEWRAAERDYFSRTGIFPIMHAVGIKRDLFDANPWLAGALFEAFESAKAMAIAELAVTNAPKATLPWVAAELRATRNIMGDDYWPYGVSQNRKVLESLIRWSYEDELTSRRLSIDELFVPSMLDT